MIKIMCMVAILFLKGLSEPPKYTRFSSSLAYTTVASSVTFNVKHLFCKGRDSLFLQLQLYYFAFQRKMDLLCDAVTELKFLMQI